MKLIKTAQSVTTVTDPATGKELASRKATLKVYDNAASGERCVAVLIAGELWFYITPALIRSLFDEQAAPAAAAVAVAGPASQEIVVRLVVEANVPPPPPLDLVVERDGMGQMRRLREA
jgi:hypothetical protein